MVDGCLESTSDLAPAPVHHRPPGDRPPPPPCSQRTLARNGPDVTVDYRRYFAEDVAQLSSNERKAIQKVARNFYRWQGHAATIDDLLAALANPPKVGP